MSKHKHFHNIKNTRQMLQHGAREHLGPFQVWRPKPVKKTALDATNIQDGKQTPHSSN